MTKAIESLELIRGDMELEKVMVEDLQKDEHVSQGLVDETQQKLDAINYMLSVATTLVHEGRYP